MRISIFFFLSLCLCVAASAEPTAFEKQCETLTKPGKLKPADRLHRLFDTFWTYEMTEHPEEATFNGFAGQNRRWCDLSLAAIDRRKRELEAPARALTAIPRAKLSEADQLNYDLFLRELDWRRDARRFPGDFLALNQLEGVQQYVPQTLAAMPNQTVADYEDMLARLDGVPGVVAQNITLLKEGLKRGITPPKITLRDVPDQVKRDLSDSLDDSPMLAPFRKFPPSIPVAVQAQLKARALDILKTKVVPAYRELYEYVSNTYLPGCRESIGWNGLPDGDAWYGYRARLSTTTDLTPAQIHAIGLGEVERLHKEMEKVMQEVKFKGDFKAFSEYLRNDPKFFFTDAQDLLRGYRDIAKRIDPELIRLFGKLPRLPYGVLPVPPYAEKSQTTAYYEPGSPEGGRPGYYFANTYDLKTRPKWEMEALTLHEAVPGHHLQIALAEEMEAAPQFRKYGGYSAFVEGWGLYAEGLGYDLGMYQDPYSRYGQLTYEMWRSIRLVVDTGIHSMNWTRDQAIKYFQENSSKTDHDITVEVDRYIVWAGQALAYKIGQLKFRDLRESARQRLGNRFDLRAFHDTVLGGGAVPLDILESEVNRWIAKRTALPEQPRAITGS